MSFNKTRFSDLIEYIDSHLDENLNHENLAKLTYLSKFHLQREFKQAFGFSLAEYIKYKRLRAVSYKLSFRAKLLNSNVKLIDLALESGFQSAEAFSRAFKSSFAQSPSHFATSPNWLYYQNKYKSIEKFQQTRSLALAKKSQSQQVPSASSAEQVIKIVVFESIDLAVYQHRGPVALLAQSIQQFIQWRRREKLSPKISRTFNLVYDDPSQVQPQDYRFDLAVEIKDAHKNLNFADNISKQTLATRHCAYCRHIGSDQNIGQTVQSLIVFVKNHQDWQVSAEPVIFERITFFPDVSENKMITDVFLSLQEKKTHYNS